MPAFFDKLPQSYAILLTGPKNMDKTMLCIDLIKYYIAKGEKVLYMSADSSPDKVKKIFQSRDVELGRIPDKFILIDCFTPWTQEGWSEGPEYSMSTHPDVDSLKLSITKGAKRLGGRVHVIIDSASSVFEHNGPDATINFLTFICKSVGTEYESALLILHEGAHDENTYTQLRGMANGLIETMSDREMHTFLRFTQLKATHTPAQWVKFNMSEKGISFEG